MSTKVGVVGHSQMISTINTHNKLLPPQLSDENYKPV